MRTPILLILILGLVAPAVLALEMTPEEAMGKMMSCPSCKPFNEYPQLGPNIRYDIFETANGFVSTFAMADEELVPALRECETKCEATRAEAMKLSPEEADEKLCPFCSGMFRLMKRDDVKIERFETSLGHLMVATSTTEEGVKELHGYVKKAREMNALLGEAAAKMQQKGQEH